MRIPIRFTTTLVIYLASVFTSAQEPSKPVPEERFQTTLEMRDEAGKEFRKADEQLNKVFKSLLAQIESKKERANLREAQRAWLKYRDKNSEFVASLYEGGSIKPQILTGCMTVMTENRIKEIQSIIEGHFGH